MEQLPFNKFLISKTLSFTYYSPNSIDELIKMQLYSTLEHYHHYSHTTIFMMSNRKVNITELILTIPQKDLSNMCRLKHIANRCVVKFELRQTFNKYEEEMIRISETTIGNWRIAPSANFAPKFPPQQCDSLINPFYNDKLCKFTHFRNTNLIREKKIDNT
ncbi:hypothetical protein LOAG_03302 [Loa loa]|uniref:Uncharacterized protein n=1 Tax=Loa loa TaxID=7209 RepID=A0A1S0U4Q1_LOALO|nr:hypothetical protein LOAG_03302 [Loa loa]EFO25179.1 hypothetical protein LOAG_03302 [Loa loa]